MLFVSAVYVNFGKENCEFKIYRVNCNMAMAWVSTMLIISKRAVHPHN